MRWRIIKEFPKYQVSETGLVRNKRSKRILWTGPRPTPKHECAHFPDKDPTNNYVDNLRWATKKENAADQFIHGTTTRKLTYAQVRAIRKELGEPKPWKNRLKTDTEIAKRYNVKRDTIADIRLRRTWKNL